MDMKLLHELVMDYALASPEKPAAEDMRGIISYRELNARSASLSAALSALARLSFGGERGLLSPSQPNQGHFSTTNGEIQRV